MPSEVFMVKEMNKRKKQLLNELSELPHRVKTLKKAFNINHEKHAERMLKESEERYRTLLDNASDAVLIADVDGNLLEANKKAENLLGYTKAKLKRMNIAQIHPKEELKRVMHVFERMRDQMLDSCSDTKVVKRDGEVVPVDITGTAIEYGGKKLIQGIFRDITERKKMEEKLRKHREHLKQSVEKRTVELRRSKEDLELKSKTLEEVNAALRVLLRQREEDRKELEERFSSNVKKLVLPYVEKLKKANLDPRNHSYLSIIESNLHELISPFLHTIQQLNLSPREIQVASLVKDGRTTKEVSEIIGVAPSAIDFYRKNIRRKLHLKKKNHNLQAYLQSLK
jgi:PAS domain S-box-containing protein